DCKYTTLNCNNKIDQVLSFYKKIIKVLFLSLFMQKNKRYIFLTLIGVLCLVIIGYHLTNYLAHSKLTAFLNDNDKSPIQNFENLKVNIWKGQLQANNIEVKWAHTELGDANRAKSKSIQIQGIKFYKIWKENKVVIGHLE